MDFVTATVPAGQARTVILFPPDTFPFWLNNQRELVKLIHVGIQGEKTVKQFAKQVDIALSGKSITVERHLHVQPAQQKTVLKALNAVVPDIQDGIEATVVQLVVPPVIERERAAQHQSAAHHIEKPGAQMAHHPPVETILRRRVCGQRRLAEITHGEGRVIDLFTAVQQRALQRPAR